MTHRLQQTLVRAEDEARRLKDEYVSVEHLVLALLEDGASGRILAAKGITRDSFLATLTAALGVDPTDEGAIASCESNCVLRLQLRSVPMPLACG